MNSRRPSVIGAPICIGLLVVAACASTASPSPSSLTPTAPPTGGTLRVAMDLAGDEFGTNPDSGLNATWDPQATAFADQLELFRCCLLRTLLSYSGHSVRGGGAVLQPDLAAGLPSISADGLTWTFPIKSGIHYAPPMADTEIVAGDFVRALERALRPDPFPQNPSGYTFYAPYFTEVIAGASEFGQGKTSAISGLETPDDHTLVIHLVKPTGDLGSRLALPLAAPIPPGAADGHDKGYGPFLVASGPYMIEGSDQLDPSLPADQQRPVSGYVPGDHLHLIRNPSWDRATDSLRSAFVDRIEVSNIGDYAAVMSAIQADQMDVSLTTDLNAADVTSLRSDSAVASRVHVTPGLVSRYINMNLAVPPFDDIHVRRAIELATDKTTIVPLIDPTAVPQTHAIPDAFENGLLADYDPFATPGGSGDIAGAKAEMKKSAYDGNKDGMCDSPACQHIAFPVRNDKPEIGIAAREFVAEMAALGIQLDFSSPVAAGDIGDPKNHGAIGFDLGWASDYFSATAWFEPLATSAAIGSTNPSLIGATPEQLAHYGYTVTTVPSLDERISTCSGLSGGDAFGCWSSVDQYTMERVVAWVPLSTAQASRLTSTSVTGFDFDAAYALPALDQIQVAH